MHRTTAWFSLLLFIFCSCKTISVIDKINDVGTDVSTFTNKDKTVKFLQMHHLGKPEFYENVKQLVDSLKKDGYVVYYETTQWDEIRDSVTHDHYLRKFRKMLGFYLDSTGYANMFHDAGVFKKMISQPSYVELGLDANDMRADLPANRLIDIYEENYGVIQLEPGDLQMPLTGKNILPKSLRLPKDKVMSVVIDQRNKNLARTVQSSSANKILILYGAEHDKGSFEELAKLDESWKRN